MKNILIEKEGHSVKHECHYLFLFYFPEFIFYVALFSVFGLVIAKKDRP